MGRPVGTGAALITVLMVLFAALAANAAAKQTEVSFYSGYTGPDGEVVKGIVADFEKANPEIKVAITALQFTPLFSKFMVDMRAGNAPDILHLHPQEIAFFVEQGLFDQELVAKLVPRPSSSE